MKRSTSTRRTWRRRAAVVSLVLAAGCATAPAAPVARIEAVRAEIEAAIARGVEATRTQDIDAYMEGIPEDLVVHDESGEVVTRDELRASTLRDWSVIPETLAIEVVIDSLELGDDGDTATVYTSQRWERRMLRPDGSGSNVVLTTQRHRETWRETDRGWLLYEVEELGGEVFVDGERYEPGG